MNNKSRILVTGAAGVVGNALVKFLSDTGYENVYTPSSKECDLRCKDMCETYFKSIAPEYVFHLAGRVYGLGGNSKYRAIAIYDNLMINTHVINASQLCGVKKIVAMGTVAMYPDPAINIPSIESDLWGGYPHKSEESYAVAKLTMLSTLEAYKNSYDLEYSLAISTNLYGPNDRFNIETGHVIPSLIKKFYIAKQEKKAVQVWGSGVAERDFLYSTDAAEGLVNIMTGISGPVNLVSGKVVSIKTLVNILSEITGVDNVEWDPIKPNGQLLRAYDSAKLQKLGFEPKVDISEGLKLTWEWYCKNIQSVRA